jgi:aminoglycoside 3-N-acetyltransferase
MVTLETIVESLHELGVRDGDRVLVHSSLRKFKYVEGGAQTVICGLLKAVGGSGTILMPTLTGRSEDGPRCPPQFVVSTTPGWTGKISETFRQWPGALRSLGPTHSVAALGADAHYLVLGHENCRTPCGEESPYVKLAKAQGKIIFFGVSLEANTTFHAAEELAGVPYHLQSEPTRCLIIDQAGHELKRDCFLHDWRYRRRFNVLEEILFRKGILKLGLVGPAPTFVLESAPMMEFTLELLKTDPWYLVETEELGTFRQVMRKVERFYLPCSS